MRLRNIPRAEGVIQMHRTVIKRPEDQRGCWHQVFGDRHPIYIEIGMGKGQFILNMAKAHPDVNFIGIERYSSVLLRALEKFDTEEYRRTAEQAVEDFPEFFRSVAESTPCKEKTDFNGIFRTV